VFARGGRYWVRDLESTNGTLLDGVLVREAELSPGATLRVGNTELKFVIDEPRPGEAELPGLFFVDPAMQQVVDAVRRAAPTSAPVLVLGENGSGKEVVARAVHALSPRAREPFVALNCGALPETLVESELFGHEKGAFTGATDRRAGAFEEAHRGTLFLDEVGDLPLEQQVKLLRALETGEVRRVGAQRAERVDVRVVAATHRDLFGAVEAGAFREDLFYRLYVVPVTVPSLRQRPLDILALADRFLGEMAPAPEIAFSADARKALLRHPWPGNVRELRNAVQRGLVFRDGAQVSEAALRLHLSPRVRRDGLIDPAGKTLEEVENVAVRLAWERHGGNRSAMARELDISRSTLGTRLKALGLDED
jgi:DNA-binding NtrC family response regulator